MSKPAEVLSRRAGNKNGCRGVSCGVRSGDSRQPPTYEENPSKRMTAQHGRHDSTSPRIPPWLRRRLSRQARIRRQGPSQLCGLNVSIDFTISFEFRECNPPWSQQIGRLAVIIESPSEFRIRYATTTSSVGSSGPAEFAQPNSSIRIIRSFSTRGPASRALASQRGALVEGWSRPMLFKDRRRGFSMTVPAVRALLPISPRSPWDLPTCTKRSFD